jgi:phospholipid/cholesterol/gamma-HCH transport system substrate-binding protein
MPARRSVAERLDVARAAVAAALAIAVVAVLAIVLGGGPDYTVHARFEDAGQLVKGDLVEVGGRPIGTISDIGLSEDGQADVALRITDGDFAPLRRGTVTRIRTVGLSGVANRFVDVSPGPRSGAQIADGGVLSTAQTRPVVDLDELLNALDAETRADLQGIIRDGAKIYGGSGRDANRALAYLNPALSETRALGDELTLDAAAVDRLIATSSEVVGALAARRTDVEQGIANTAATLRALAGRRDALRDALGRAPGVLGRARGTLARVRSTLSQVRPALRELRPSAPELARTLRAVVPAARSTDPVARRLRDVLPQLTAGLDGLPALARGAVPALRSTTSAVRDALPIFAGLRPYAPDLYAGIFGGFGGTTSATYDANGHFTRVAAVTVPGGTPGLGSLIPGLNGTAGRSGLRTGVDARCPGAATEPGPDASNPYAPDPSLCTREDDHP